METETLDGNALTFGEVLLEVRSYILRVLRKWPLFLVACLLGAAYGYWSFSKKSVKFSSEVSFIINDGSSGGGLGQVSGLLSSFGLGGGSSGGLNPKTIISLLKSNLSARKYLGLSEGITTVDSTLLPRIINLKEYKGALENLKLDEKNLSLENEKLLREKVLIEKVIGNDNQVGIITAIWDDEDKTITIKATSTDEKLSHDLSLAAYRFLEEFYDRDALGPQEITFDLLKSKSDSLRARIQYLSNRLAKFEDSKKGLLLKSQSVKKQEISRDLSVSTIAYAKALENQAISEFALSTNQQKFKTIDQSSLPLTKDTPNLISSVILSIALALTLTSVIILASIIYTDAIRSAEHRLDHNSTKS